MKPREFETILVTVTYVFDSGHHYIQCDSHIHLVDYKHLHSDTLRYKLLKRKKKETHTSKIISYFDSNCLYILWGSHIHLFEYKCLHLVMLGHKLLIAHVEYR